MATVIPLCWVDKQTKFKVQQSEENSIQHLPQSFLHLIFLWTSLESPNFAKILNKNKNMFLKILNIYNYRQETISNTFNYTCETISNTYIIHMKPYQTPPIIHMKPYQTPTITDMKPSLKLYSRPPKGATL